MTLPAAFLARPISHRALHDRAQGRPENSRAAIRAAIAQDYGIEIDLQPSADGVAMVFHDDTLDRLTGRQGRVSDFTAEALGGIALSGGDEGIPTLTEVLEIVAGRVPLLIEIKDQDGAMGPDVGVLEQATATALQGYDGPVALMSFNPHAVAEMARLAPDLPRGLTTCGYDADDWPELSAETRADLRAIADFDRVGASFISHQITDLGAAPVAELRARGVPVLCWTVRTPAEEAEARKLAGNITFEQYLA
ncbi:glycerophosphodiester phosphodiesterase family protein [Marinovum sp.]|uniref:glycerophosphodiester phosphodiesterase family protein n=1 Tax=Marinovum sp. TaxID=2024839 RepID=UPI002B26E67F|nr:glycerophosphodiester phosphodiesterase family protein [Marinovum sp.]